MANIKKLRVDVQRADGKVLTKDDPNAQTKDNTAAMLMGDMAGTTSNGKNAAKVNDVKDGVWIMLQDWTQCTLKCGGGLSYYQRLCNPPKSGGAPCVGEATLTKPCNTQPCPTFQNSQEDQKKKADSILKPIIKVMQYSQRPQRYSKCIVKESDLLMTNTTDLSKTTNEIQIPVRVVLNNRTLSAFQSDDYSSQHVVYNLDHAVLGKSSRDHKCFVVKESGRGTEFCPFGADSEERTLIEWDYAFNLFKKNCRTDPDFDKVDLDAQLNATMADKMKGIKGQMLEERETLIKKQMRTKEEDKMNNLIKQTGQVADLAVNKEVNLEQMIEKEEADREADAEKEMETEIASEANKDVNFLLILVMHHESH